MSRPGRPAGRHVPPTARHELTAVSSDGTRIHVEVHGREGAPVVVLAHGWTCSTAFWAEQIRALAPTHRVIAYDQRGHGRSTAPTGPDGYSTGALCEDLLAVLALTMEPGERAVFGGHSMGGMTLMAAAGRSEFAARAAAVLLCSTGSSRLVDEARVVPLRAGRARARLTRALLGSRLPLGPITPPARQVLKYATMGPATDPCLVEACARIVHACPPRVRHGWSRVLEGLDLGAGVRALDVPTRVIGGTVDRLTPIVQARHLAATLPRCVGLIELPGMGHMTPMEAPEAISSALADLVEEYLSPSPPAEPSTGAQPASVPAEEGRTP
ncbi:alpha/beta fold hydrolase [Streptomyces sp. NPDC006879]|uniref:alpha/beta fold hydrolase n=1 Tax=Streptomyces sp. NPDC006879 TaxID=3364767 RepID=UPI0036BA1B04